MSKASLAGVPRMVRHRRLLLALAAATLACRPQSASAQAADYPNRVIRLIVPFAAGSGTDLSARHFAKKITELTGQPVVVDNRAGGNGFPAVMAVKAAPADGYTLLFGSSSTLATNLALFKTLPYDPLADFVPISAVMKTASLLVVSPGSPYKTIGDVVDAAKKSPGRLNAGTGSAAFQLAAELFMEKTGVKMLNVPYKGVPEVLLAVMSGQVDLGFVEISASAELIRTGKLRPLVVASDQRLPSFSSIPTSADAGIAGFTAYPGSAGWPRPPRPSRSSTSCRRCSCASWHRRTPRISTPRRTSRSWAAAPTRCAPSGVSRSSSGSASPPRPRSSCNEGQRP